MPHYTTEQSTTGWELEKARTGKLAELDEEWNEIISKGWGSGYGMIDLSTEGMLNIFYTYILAKEAANFSYPLPFFLTINNQEIRFSDIQTITTFVLQYGTYRNSLAQTFAARKRAIAAALTVEQIERI